ncbi:MAG TPA: YceI family protein [Solirubrobacteraceae bacterium]|jgi:polyisoprenoid-binding protein YceI|nr:YceI family protein [Solirubrobacteraceae bacterium]
MSSTATASLPAGTWNIDPVHSQASFAVKHMAVALFRGRFDEIDASLTVDEGGNGALVGTVKADSLVVRDPNLQAHLGAPDFFDIERYPEITFRSSSIAVDGDAVTLEGELTIKDQTHPLQARGTISGPVVTLGDVTKVGLDLEAVIDRTQYGLSFNAPLPKGGVALANDVRLIVDLELALAA